MPTKTIITTVTVGVHDPDKDTPEVRDANGALLLPASAGAAFKGPGEEVTLDADEADSILARFGGEVIDDDAPRAPRRRAAR